VPLSINFSKATCGPVSPYVFRLS